MPYYSRKANRLPYYDYSSANYYFLTICTDKRNCIFGKPGQLNSLGNIAARHLEKISVYYPNVRIDKYVVMPNHVHMILVLDNTKCPSVSRLMAYYKAGVTREIRNSIPDMEIWQRSFHDHIIRSQKDYERIWLYIESNPENWKKDMFYMEETTHFA